MNNEVSKPTREELKERLRMAQMRGKLGRLPKKQRDEKVEKIKSQMEEQQNAFMEQLKKLTPEQRKSMGLPEIDQPAEELNNNVQPVNSENNQTVSGSNPMSDSTMSDSTMTPSTMTPSTMTPSTMTPAMPDPMTIPLQLPRMKPIVKQEEPLLINIHNKKLEI